MILTLSKSDYNFFCKYADDPFSEFNVDILDDKVVLRLYHSNHDVWHPFEVAYDDAYLEHTSGPDYEPDSIGQRLEQISDDLVRQSYNQ